MEVHHHAHTSRKKWTHYFWEFFMLFLAITLGFIVENWREHIVEHRREKQYISSMIEDLKSDTISLNIYLSNQRIAMTSYDSVIYLLNQTKRTSEQQKRLYYIIRIALRYNDFPKFEGITYEQMKSSGNLRLIREQNVADSISHYYSKTKETSDATSQLLLRQQSLLGIEGDLFDGLVFHNMLDKKTFAFTEPAGDVQLVTDDRKIINKCIVSLHYLFSITLYSMKSIQNQIDEATRLILFLKDEYHLK